MRALAAALVVLAVCAPGCREKKTVDKHIDLDTVRKLPRLYADDISQVTIDDGTTTVVLRRDGDGEAWRIAAPLSEPADPLAIKGMLSELSTLEWDADPVAVGRSDWDAFHIADDQALAVTIVSKGEPLPTLYLGNRGHARVGTSAHVFPVYRLNRYTFERELRLWRDLRLTGLERDAIEELSVAAGDVTARARRDGDAWTLIGDPPAGRVFDPEVPAQLAQRLATVRAHDIADGVDRARAGLDAPALVITAHTAAGDTIVELGGTEPATGLRYVGVRGEKRVWTVATDGKATIDHGPDTWFK